jgi:hypothetical protein
VLDRGEAYRPADEDDVDVTASDIKLISEPDVTDTSLSGIKLIPEDPPSKTAPPRRAGGLTLTGNKPTECDECRVPLEVGDIHLCRSCAAVSRRRAEQSARVRRAGTRACTECGEPTPTITDTYCVAHGSASVAAS